VLAPQILMCIEEKRWRNLGIFLMRRWMRTIPPYVVALICASVLLGELGSADFFRYLFYVQNLCEQANHDDYFSIAWSLSVEEWFYLVFPAIIFVISILLARRDIGTTFTAAVLFIATITVVRTLYGPLDDWGAGLRRVVIFRIDSIAYGFLLYVTIHRARRNILGQLPMLAVFASLLLSIALALWLTLEIDHTGSAAAKHILPFMAVLLGATAIMLAVKVEHRFQLHPRLSNCGLFLGRVSYSIYLFHIIFVMVLAAALASAPLMLQFALYLFVMLVFSTLFFAGFERPILRARPRYMKRKETFDQLLQEA